MAETEKPLILEDDTKENMSLLIEHRLPWLVVGFIGGIGLTFVASRFETLLEANLGLTFFIPIIVYMASAVGTQADTVYIRNLDKKRTRFSIYLVKEVLLGAFLGILFGTIAGFVSFLLFQNFEMALSVALAMAITMATAPIVALTVPTILKREHKDPAIGTGPFVTVIQDLISLLIYFSIASFILFR